MGQNMIKYYKLTDEENYDEIVKNELGEYYIYIFGEEKWKKSYIMNRYELPEDLKYNKFVIINEKEAKETINKKRIKFIKLLEKSKIISKGFLENRPIDKFENMEQKIIAILYYTSIKIKLLDDELINIGFTKRILKSLKLLNNRKSKNYLEEIKEDNNAWSVKIEELKNNIEKLNGIDKAENYKKELELLQS